MKTPPFLLFATLLFWGWQSGFLLVGAGMGVVLESARFVRGRWDLDDADFNRIWTFCVLLNVVLAAYVFTTNDAGGGLAGMIHGRTGLNVVNSGVQTATRFLRWLPMTTFAFMAAQAFNERPSVPLTAVSLVLGWRRRRGDQAFAGHYLDVSFPYFMVCLFSAGIHTNLGTQTLFWGECALATWALWSLRSRRFGMAAWLAALAMVIGLGFLGEFGINQAQVAIQNFNAQWLARFFGQHTDPLQSMTSMGQIGRLKLSAKIVVWLEPQKVGQVPDYLREASYRVYDARHQTWYAGGTLSDFESVPPEPDNTSWVLVPGKTGAASVNIACYLNGRSTDGDPQGVLPLPAGSSRLENLPAVSSVIALQKNQNGTVLAIGSGLMIFDARYGPDATLDAPRDIQSTNGFDLAVATNEIPALDQVISEMKIPVTDDDQAKLRIVKKFFFDKFTYSIWQGEDKRATADATPLTRFLLTSRSGHCEYFATATVLLLREMKIPARYAVGYFVHEPSGSGYVARERDAHAWCLVWDRAKNRWVDFDTTPPSWVAIESQRTAVMEWLADLRSWLFFQFEEFRWHQAHMQQYILWTLVPVMIVLLYHILFRRRRRPKGRAQKEQPDENFFWPGLDSEFYLLEKKLAARGTPRQPGEPLADWLERVVAGPVPVEMRGPLQKLLRLHYRHRFDPQGLNVAEREALRRDAKTCLDSLPPIGLRTIS
ncbi:MAG TPA: transglutaminase domain-containing protein [Verrucomicrobiae bacterium]